MASIVIDDIKVPMTDLTFHYVKNGTFKRKALLTDAIRAAHEEGDGTGRVYSLDEYSLERNSFHLEARVYTLTEPVEGYPFSGKAALRNLSKANGCLHNTTTVAFQKDYPEHGTTTQLTSCSDCMVLLKRISRKVDKEGAETVTERYVGDEPLCDDGFCVVEKLITSSETITIDGVQVPLVYEKFATATRDPFTLPLVFDTAEEAKKYTLEEGDGSMIYMVSKLYQSVSSTVSYEVEVTEHVGVMGWASEEAHALYTVKVAQQACEHLNTVKVDHVLDTDGNVVEYAVTTCVDCDKQLAHTYFVDSCQLEYTATLMERTAEQAACGHNETKLKPTPNGYLGCLNLDSSVSVYCAQCDAMLHTSCALEDDNILSYKSVIAASYAW